jgi:leader peptidase (prepilin peptidase)/N-methyltransferase
MLLLETLSANPTFLVGFVFVVGLLVGSFLNVVIFRFPKMLEQNWKAEAREVLELPEEPTDTVTLSRPASTCPHCGHAIRWYENVPVLSWLWLRGKCSACGKGISFRYPAIELTSAILAATCAVHFGYGPWLAVTLLATWMLVAMAMIDFDTTLLPDNLTLPLMWLALFAALIGISPLSVEQAVTGAMAGYLSLWSVYWLFKLVTGKEGMGYGDFKLLAALGALLGWKMLPLVLLLSSVVGAVVGISLITTGAIKRQQGIPFGPYLATAGWISLLWGDTIVTAYLGLFKF